LNKLPSPQNPKFLYSIHHPESSPVPRLSIIIAVLGDPNRLDNTLVSVLENRPANCEVLVVHNEPYNDPYELAGEVRFIEAVPWAGMAECLNMGLAAGRAPVVHVLACGVEVRLGWADAALRHFRDADIAAVAAVVQDGRDPSKSKIKMKILSAGLGYRAEGDVWRLGAGQESDALGEIQEELCGPDILAAFYCRSALEAIGGFWPSATDALVGIEVALSLEQIGFRCVSEPECRVTAAAALADRPGFRRGRDAERLFWRWAARHGRRRSLLGHVALVTGECVVGLWRPSLWSQLAGRVVGAIQAIFTKPRPKPAETIDAAPAILAMPQLTAAPFRPQQRSARAA